MWYVGDEGGPKILKMCLRNLWMPLSIRRSNEDWILDILHAKTEDEGIYECQVSTEPPKIHKIFLAVEGKNQKKWFRSAYNTLVARKKIRQLHQGRN